MVDMAKRVVLKIKFPAGGLKAHSVPRRSRQKDRYIFILIVETLSNTQVR